MLHPTMMFRFLFIPLTPTSEKRSMRLPRQRVRCRWAVADSFRKGGYGSGLPRPAVRQWKIPGRCLLQTRCVFGICPFLPKAGQITCKEFCDVSILYHLPNRFIAPCNSMVEQQFFVFIRTAPNTIPKYNPVSTYRTIMVSKPSSTRKAIESIYARCHRANRMVVVR